MAWVTPFTITISTIAYALNRVNNDNFGSEWVYRDANRSITMKIRHSTDAPDKLTGRVRLRHNVQVTHRVYSTSTTKEFVRVWNHTILAPDDDDPAAVLADAVGITAAVVTTTHLTDAIAGLN